MSDPYRGVDLASLQDEIRNMGDELARLRDSHRWVDSNVRLIKWVALCVFFPVVVLVTPVLIGSLSGQVTKIHRDVLKTDRVVQDYRLRALAVDVDELRRLRPVRDAGQEGGYYADGDAGQDGWRCVMWGAW